MFPSLDSACFHHLELFIFNSHLLPTSIVQVFNIDAL